MEFNVTPNFSPTFKFNAEVEILDETGFPTGRRGYVHARYRGSAEDTDEYAIMLAGPIGGGIHVPAARLRLVKPAQEQRTPHSIRQVTGRKRRARAGPLVQKIERGNPPESRARQNQDSPGSKSSRFREDSTDPALASSSRDAK